MTQTPDNSILAKLDDNEFEALLARKSEEFEEHLIKIEQDPLKRALARRDFYQKQRDIRVERLRCIPKGEQKERERIIRNRQFSVYGNKKYHGTHITSEIENEEKYMNQVASQTTIDGKDRHPFFLGEDGTVYDVNYIPIKPKKEILENKRGKFSTIINNRDEDDTRDGDYSIHEYTHDPELYKNPPEPDCFDTFEEYEDALLAWSADVQKSLGYLQLPNIMGRHYYRPYVLNEEMQEQLKKETESQKKQDSDFPFVVDKTLQLDDPWESHLIPFEPKPEFYNTFEEYEKAMVRWATVCFGLTFIPPHPAQFQKLLGIKLDERPEYTIPDIDIDIQLPQKKELHTQIKQIVKKKPKKVELKVQHYELKNEWEKIPQEDKDRVMEEIDRQLRKQEESFNKYGCYHRELHPRIHGTFPRDDKLMRRLSLTDVTLKLGDKKKDNPTNVREWIMHQRRERSLSSVFASNTMPYYQAIAEDLRHQIPLRRLDLTEEEIKKSYDCEEFIQNTQIKFKVPEFDVGQIDFSKLDNPSYIRFLQILLTRIDHGSRYEHLNSWYYPTIPQTVHEEQIRYLQQLLKVEHPSQISEEMLVEVFMTDAYLDIFAKWLASPLPQRMFVFIKGKEEELKCYVNLLFSATNVQNFKIILGLFNNANSKLVHAKVSDYILEFMKVKLAEINLESLINDRDVDSLYYVAKAVTFYDEVQIQLFEYKPHIRDLVKQTMGVAADIFICDLMIIYYLDCICVSLLEEEKVFEYVYPMLIRNIEDLIKKGIVFLQNNETFLGTQLWTALGHRSVEFSNLGLFILSFLFTLAWNPKIQHILHHPNTCLVDNIRTLSYSKLSHVQSAISLVWPTLKKKEWKGLLTNTYSNAENVVKDLILSAQRTALDAQPPLISSMVGEFLVDILEVKKKVSDNTAKLVKGLLKTNAFNNVFHEVLQTYHQRRMHQGTIQGAKFLAVFAKYLICNNLISVKTDKINQKGTGWSQRLFGRSKQTKQEEEEPDDTSKYVIITESTIVTMMDFVCSQSQNRRTYRARMHMLECLRHLLKCPEVFNKLVKLNKAFVAKIIEICKDGTEMEFNKQAWRLFYQLIKFHPGVLEQIGKNGQLTSFLELIGSGSSSVVMKNSIYFFNKIFNLPKNENEIDDDDDNEDDDVTPKIKETKKGFNVPADDVVKQYDKTVTYLLNYIKDKHLMVIIHMAYKRLSADYAGWPFQSMVKFYETLEKHSLCKRFTDAFKKNDEYREGIEHIHRMIKGVDQ